MWQLQSNQIGGIGIIRLEPHQIFEDVFRVRKSFDF